jgi:hypothetical protein
MVSEATPGTRRNPGRVNDSRASYRDGSGVLSSTLSDAPTVGKRHAFDLLEHRFGADRMHVYLRAAGGDRDLALRSYEWNSRIAGALLVDLGHLEVAVRNALDARMRARHAARRLPGSWLDDPEQELGRDPRDGRHRQPFADIEAARRRVRQNRKPLSHGQVLSETSFGLWHQLVSKRWTNLWPDLADAFPHAPDRRRETVARRVSGLRELRNRIGHHHRVWGLPCATRHDDLLAVAGFVDPDLREWIARASCVPTLLAERPTARR